MNNEEKISMVDTAARALRQLCHSKHCHYTTNCPEDHPACKANLDMRTAVAWQAARTMEAMSWAIHNKRRSDIKLGSRRLGLYVDLTRLHLYDDPLVAEIYQYINKVSCVVY